MQACRKKGSGGATNVQGRVLRIGSSDLECCDIDIPHIYTVHSMEGVRGMLHKNLIAESVESVGLCSIAVLNCKTATYVRALRASSGSQTYNTWSSLHSFEERRHFTRQKIQNYGIALASNCKQQQQNEIEQNTSSSSSSNRSSSTSRNCLDRKASSNKQQLAKSLSGTGTTTTDQRKCGLSKNRKAAKSNKKKNKKRPCISITRTRDDPMGCCR